MTAPLKAPNLYLSAPHECSYLPERTASTLIVDPAHPVTPPLYQALVTHGFRRSGSLVYRPHCQQCQACVSVRVPVRNFAPSRSQRRNWRDNADLTAHATTASFDVAHFALYRRYQSTRHPGGAMDDPDPDKYRDFLCDGDFDTMAFEYRLGRTLVAVAIADLLPDGVSAIYTFYDPEHAHRGLGTYAILWQIDYARRAGLDWAYLGYWIADCDKMSYKTDFRPIEVFDRGQWRSFPP